MPTTQVGSHVVTFDEHGEGHPLLLIPGIGLTRFTWWKQIGPLSRKLRVLNIDNRDAGDSALGRAPYTIADMAEDVAGVIENLHLGPTYVMGWSMGGFIALELTVRHPALVKKLILVATSAGGPTKVLPAPEIGALLLPNESEDIETRERRAYALLSGQGYTLAHPEDLDQWVRNAKAKPMAPEAYQRQLTAVMTWGGVSDRLAQGLAAPTLVIHGDADPLVPYANGQHLAAHIPNAKLSTYPGVGHLVPIDAADRLNREVSEFLGE
jgi:pimeloyl-ACP methyl ester carboxylesterase